MKLFSIHFSGDANCSAFLAIVITQVHGLRRSCTPYAGLIVEDEENDKSKRITKGSGLKPFQLFHCREMVIDRWIWIDEF